MKNDEQLLYTIAKMYYLENLNQAEISEKLSLSRPKVSRLLAKAREDGIVDIHINTPTYNNVEELALQIRTLFALEHVLVVPTMHESRTMNLEYTAKHAAPFFRSLLRDGDKVGISWGYTLLKLVENFPPSALAACSILQISGNLDNADSSNYAHEIVRHFFQKLDASALKTLPCPVMVENSIIVDLLLHDSKISTVISQINEVDVAFPNIGVLSEENCLWRTGYISTDELHKLHRVGSVGCVCCRFIDAEGQIVDPSLDERTISISLAALQRARFSCVCVAGEEKVAPLLGSLRAKLVNVLAIDSQTAAALLEQATRHAGGGVTQSNGQA